MPDAPAPVAVRDLKSLDANRPFTALLLLRRLSTRTASNGNAFLSAEFGDRTGTFTSTIFADHPQFDLIKGLAEGSVVRLEGKVEFYQGRLSPRIGKVESLDEAALAAEGALENLIEVSPLDPTELWSALQTFTDGIAHDELRMTVRGVFEEIGEAFRTAPAAVSMHHAYRHGLLEHTVRMARAAQALLPLYPEVDPSLTIAGILLHDTGKVIEYEGALATRRSRKGLLQGHVVLGYQLARKHGIKARLDAGRLERLEHIILSHQGEPEWGAAVYAATPEAVFVSMIDNLDARMGMVQRALRQAVEGGDEFSERLPGLSASLLLRPVGE